MSNPAFLLVELADEHPGQVHILKRVAETVRAGGGTVLASAPAGQVCCMEPGTVASGLLIARWSRPGPLSATAENEIIPMLRSSVPTSTVPLVLRVNGLPEEGLPEMMDIPTVASVPTAPKVPRNALMVIRGRAFDTSRMDQYRDIILPMMKQRDSYYEAFALQPGEVTALSGEWQEQIFAISRWPEKARADDFWYSDQYQQTAIPKRIGAGRFSVHLLDAAD